MSGAFYRPENTLKRAKELLSIPNIDSGVLYRTKISALETLHDGLLAKKQRTWQPAHEELMLLYLDICIELLLGKIAKDGLHQYRNLFIQQNTASVEKIILHFASQTQAKLAKVARDSKTRILLSTAKVDLEGIQSSEAELLSSASFDTMNEQTDREIVFPWLRFTWETFRTILEISKNNSKLESLYKIIAFQAFAFCVEYNRKIEFRRLCEILRHHLGNLQKHTAAPTVHSTRQLRAWEGFTSESVHFLLCIRFRQLEVSMDLTLYSEAFRTIDDIHTIMHLIDTESNAALIVKYYEKLAEIFFVSENHLFHACALVKCYRLEPSLEKEELANRVMLAALAIPIAEDDKQESAQEWNISVEMREKNARMATLLGYTCTPTRAELVMDIEQMRICEKASKDIQSLYAMLEAIEIDPLQIVKNVRPILHAIRQGPAYASAYVSSVENLLVRRVLYQLTQVYSSVTIDRLESIFRDLHISYREIEQLIVRSRSLSVLLQSGNFHGTNTGFEMSSGRTGSRSRIRIDHIQQCVHFNDGSETHPNQLCLLGERLSRVLKVIDPCPNDEKTTQLFAHTRNQTRKTRDRMLQRKHIIEQQKEELERLQTERKALIQLKKAEYDDLRQRLEKMRLAKEFKRREMEKKQKIKDEIAMKEAKQMLSQLGHENVEDFDLGTLDREKLMLEANLKAQRAKEDAQRKFRESARRLDYIIRATREEEEPILQERFAQRKEDILAAFKRQKELERKKRKEMHAFGIAEKEKLAPARTICQSFEEARVSARKIEYAAKKEEHHKRVMLEKLMARIARAKERARAEEKMKLAREEEEKARLKAEKEQEMREEEERNLERARKEKEELARVERDREESEKQRANVYRPPTLRDESSSAWATARARKSEIGSDRFARPTVRVNADEEGPWRGTKLREDRDTNPRRQADREGSRSSYADRGSETNSAWRQRDFPCRDNDSSGREYFSRNRESSGASSRMSLGRDREISGGEPFSRDRDSSAFSSREPFSRDSSAYSSREPFSRDREFSGFSGRDRESSSFSARDRDNSSRYAGRESFSRDRDSTRDRDPNHDRDHPPRELAQAPESRWR